MDLSDDIAYSVHDVEDAVVRESVSPRDLYRASEQERIVAATVRWYRHPSADRLGEALQRLLEQEAWPKDFSGSYIDLATMKDLTSDLIGRFISSVCEATSARYGTGPLVRYEGDVVVPQETADEITILKGIAVNYVMLPRESEPLYFEQRTMLFDLVDVLMERPDQLEPHFLDLWRYSDEAGRLRVVVDQVASLTDQSARKLHSELCGMLRN